MSFNKAESYTSKNDTYKEEVNGTFIKIIMDFY